MFDERVLVCQSLYIYTLPYAVIVDADGDLTTMMMIFVTLIVIFRSSSIAPFIFGSAYGGARYNP